MKNKVGMILSFILNSGELIVNNKKREINFSFLIQKCYYEYNTKINFSLCELRNLISDFLLKNRWQKNKMEMVFIKYFKNEV